MSLKYIPKPTPLPSSLLSEAGDLFLTRQAERFAPKTLESNKSELKHLLNFFGDIPLSEFHIGHFEHYQVECSKKLAASHVNHQLNTLSRLLKLAGLWGPIHGRYKPLPLIESKTPKIFTAAEQALLFKKLKGNPNLDLAEIVFTITRNTTASGIELRTLQLRDVELEADPPRIHVKVGKNNSRPRTIPLNAEALSAFQRALARANRLGAHYPESYLFPFRVNRAHYNARRPASSSWLRKQTAHLREITQIDHLKPHTFRHLAVTELLEAGAPEQTVVELAGWVSRKMFATYGHARIEAKSDAVALIGKPREPIRSPAPAPTEPVQTDAMTAMIQAEVEKRMAQFLQGLFSGAGKQPG